jgi:ribonuclease Z
MALDLTFIGTGNAFAPTRYWSSFLVDGRYLFDAPPTLLPHLKKLGANPSDIEVIFISHFHADHFFGLPFLLLEYAELNPRTKDLTIVGPPGIARRAQTLTDLGFPNVFRKDRGYHLEFIEAADNATGECGGCQWTAREVPHVAGLECFAYRVTTDGGTVAYSGDSRMADVLVPLANDADAFVVECSCWDDDCGPHIAPHELLELHRRVTPTTQFVVTHMGAGDAPKQLRDAGMLFPDDLQTVHINGRR